MVDTIWEYPLLSVTRANDSERSYVFWGLIVLNPLLQVLNEGDLQNPGLLFRVPLPDLRQVVALEVLLEMLARALVCWEKLHDIFDASALQGSGEMFHGLINEEGPEYQRDNVDGHIYR